jgi:hypothetical protein
MFRLTVELPLPTIVKFEGGLMRSTRPLFWTRLTLQLVAAVEPLFEMVTDTDRELFTVIPSGEKPSEGGVPPAGTVNKGETNTGVFGLEQDIWSLNARCAKFQIIEIAMDMEFAAGR